MYGLDLTGWSVPINLVLEFSEDIQLIRMQ